MEEHQFSREFPPRLRCVGVLPATTTRRHDDVLRLVATPTTETGLFPGQEESGPCPEDRRRATPARVQAHVLRRGKAASLREQRLRRRMSPFRATTKPRDRHETTGSFRASAVPRDRHETISLTVEADHLSKKCSLRSNQTARRQQGAAETQAAQHSVHAFSNAKGHCIAASCTEDSDSRPVRAAKRQRHLRHLCPHQRQRLRPERE